MMAQTGHYSPGGVLCAIVGSSGVQAKKTKSDKPEKKLKKDALTSLFSPTIASQVSPAKKAKVKVTASSSLESSGGKAKKRKTSVSGGKLRHQDSLENADPPKKKKKKKQTIETPTAISDKRNGNDNNILKTKAKKKPSKDTVMESKGLSVEPSTKTKKRKKVEEMEVSQKQSLEAENIGRKKRKVKETEGDSQKTPQKTASPNKTIKLNSKSLDSIASKKVLVLGEAEDEEKKRYRKKRDREREGRTVFVGNLANTTEKRDIKKIFREFGEINTVRLRSAAPSDAKLPKKAVIVKKMFHEGRHNISAYIEFSKKEQATAALKLNGTEHSGLTLRVDIARNAKKHNHKRSIFLGNLPFDIEEDEVRKHFEVCGEVENVRLVRDNKTGLGKGFGYVLFQESEAVNFALKLAGEELKGRKLRVSQSAEQSKADGRTRGEVPVTEAGKKRVKKNLKLLPSNLKSRDYMGFKSKHKQKLRKKEKFRKKLLKRKSSDKTGPSDKSSGTSRQIFARNRLSKKIKKSK